MQFAATAFDLETLPFRKGRMAPPIACLSYADTDGRVGLLHHSEIVPFVQRMLGGGAIMITHNGCYDWACLMAHEPAFIPAIFQAYDDNRVHDTLIREQLIDLRRGLFRPGRYSLGDTAKRRLGVDLDKDTWRQWYENLRDKPLYQWPDGAKRYCLDDAIATRDVYLSQEADGSPTDQHNQTRAALWLHLCGAWGIKTDPKRVDELAGALEAERDQLLVTLKAEGLVRANGTRNMRAVEQRVREAYEKQGDETPAGGYAACPTTPGGKPKTDAATCDASGDPLLKAYGRLGEINSKLNNYVPVLRMGTVHARYGLAETGRTTCTIYLGKGNLQNLPRSGGVRECFAPRPGRVFAGADYDGLELRTVAQSCLKLVGHSELAKALNAGLDPHLALAAQILGVDYDSAKARKKAGDKEIDNARQTAKVANFGFPGGLGAERFVEYAKGSYGVDISVERARELKQQWLQRWPEFVAYFRHIDVTDQVTHLFSGRIRGGEVPYTVAANSFFQGLGADAAKRAGWLLCRACYSEPKSPLFGSRIVLFAHDEFLLEVPDDERADPAAREMARLMCEGANQFLPDVPATTEAALMRFYSKDAKSIYDSNGRLVAWPTDQT